VVGGHYIACCCYRSLNMCMTVVVVLSVIAEMSSTFCGWISSFSCSLICCLYNLVIRFSTLGWLESKCGKVLILLWKCLSSESAWFDVGKSFIYRTEKRWLGDKDGTNTPSLLCFRAHNLSVNKLQLERCPMNGTNPLSLLEKTWMDCRDPVKLPLKRQTQAFRRSNFC